MTEVAEQMVVVVVVVTFCGQRIIVTVRWIGILALGAKGTDQVRRRSHPRRGACRGAVASGAVASGAAVGGGRLLSVSCGWAEGSATIPSPNPTLTRHTEAAAATAAAAAAAVVVVSPAAALFSQRPSFEEGSRPFQWCIERRTKGHPTRNA